MSNPLIGSRVGFGFAALVTSSVTLASWGMQTQVHIPDISLLYVPAILMTAILYGAGPSVVCAILAILEFDFFLIDPKYTLVIARPEDVLAFFVFVTVALVTSRLAFISESRARTAERHARDSGRLHALGQSLLSNENEADALREVVVEAMREFSLEGCSLFVPNAVGRVERVAEAGLRMDSREAEAAANHAFAHAKEVGLPSRAQQRRQLVAAEYLPLQAGNQCLGVLELTGLSRLRLGGDQDRVFLNAFATQTALVLERMRVEERRRQARIIEDADRVKSSLLSTVSHDLRTPLATIKGSATSMLQDPDGWSNAERRELLQAIDHECDRLNRLVGNLLDFSRIEGGALHPRLDWYELDEIFDEVGSHVTRLPGATGRHVVLLDLLLIRQVIGNLTENAARFGGNGPVEIGAEAAAEEVCIWVRDHGPGIEPSQVERVFRSFVQGSRKSQGVGLGLAICKGIVDAHKGRITIEETPHGGTTVVVCLPQPVLASDRAQTAPQPLPVGNAVE